MITHYYNQSETTGVKYLSTLLTNNLRVNWSEVENNLSFPFDMPKADKIMIKHKNQPLQ